MLVKFDESTESEVSVFAIRLGKNRVTKNGREVLVHHTKADAVVELVKRALGAQETDRDRISSNAGVNGRAPVS